MPAKKNTPQTAPSSTETAPDASDGQTAPDAAASPWDALQAVVAMPSKPTGIGNFKVNVLKNVHPAIRQRAEASLAINTAAVADKAGSKSSRPRVDYHWDVQPVIDKAMAEAFDKAISKYAKYRPAEGDIEFKADESPMGQVTCRTGVPTHYKLPEDGVPVVCNENDEGAFWGIRYSVRPLEVRGDSKRLPGTA